MMRSSFVLLCCNSLFITTSFAITQDGTVGSSSTANIDAAFEVTRVANLSNLSDVYIGNIDPSSHGAKTLTITLPNLICFYSSTGSANVATNLLASRSQSIDINSNTAKLKSELGDTMDFRLQLGSQDLFVSTHPVFIASSSSLTCDDHMGEYPLTITINNTRVRAGTYKAIVDISVTPN